MRGSAHSPVNRRLRYKDLCTVFCSNHAVRASPPGVLKRSGTGQIAFREIPPLRFPFKKGGGIYKFQTDFLLSVFECTATFALSQIGP
jgi:hypothetical protein